MLNTDTPSSNRKLLLFGKGQAEYKEQVALLATDSVGMAERDLVVITPEQTDLKKYDVPANRFVVLLIGKDGGEKFRSTKHVEVETIFKLIDSMPMRQAEMERTKE